MFTGLIEKIGQIKKIQSDLKPTRLSIKTPFSKSLKIGESVAVNGVCLTVNKKKEDSFDID
ncbi:MAG: riboflavin synthase subunit alpha, riboflavin synthase, partial [Candidatus Peregrinibacteria bacterium GW2011_GWE2_39_6]